MGAKDQSKVFTGSKKLLEAMESDKSIPFSKLTAALLSYSQLMAPF